MQKNNSFQKLISVYFLLIALFWLGLALTHKKTGNLNYLYSFLFGLIPLVGGATGMAKSKVWGGLKSTLGKAVFYISLGLLLWGFG